VATNAGHETRQGRLYVLFLDDRQIDATRTRPTIAIAREFIETRVGPHDLVAVVNSTGRTDASVGLTFDKTVLLSVVDRFLGHKLSLTSDNSSPDHFHEARVDGGDRERLHLARRHQRDDEVARADQRRS